MSARRGASLVSTVSALLLILFTTACRRQVNPRPHIRIWHQKISAERDLFQEHVRAFNSTHPESVVEVLYKENEELRNLFVVASVAGQGPDLIYGPADNVGVLVTTKTILPLEKIFESDFFARFTSEGLVKWQGAAWLAGDQIGNHLTLVYDKKMVANPPKTLGELVRLGQAITQEQNEGRAREYALTWNYREPFFFIPFLTGFGGWVMDKDGRPTLDNANTVRAIQFVLDLRDKYKIIPQEGDYEIADMLFKEKRSAMIINGPWSWRSYDVPKTSMVACLPMNEETGLYCEPMISTKGYSVNSNLEARKVPIVRELIDYLTSASVQEEMAMKLSTTPVDRTVVHSAALQTNPALVASMEQIAHGRPMPIMPQMRQIWEGMRGPYQLVMNGAITAEEAARRMQRESEKNIADSNL